MLFVKDSKMNVTIREIMKSECFCIEIFTNTSHLYSVLGIAGPPVCIARSQKCNRIIAFLYNKHSHNFLISIDDEIAPKLIWIFIHFYKFLLWKSWKMTIFRTNHDWYLSERSLECVCCSINLSRNFTK